MKLSNGSGIHAWLVEAFAESEVKGRNVLKRLLKHKEPPDNIPDHIKIFWKMADIWAAIASETEWEVSDAGEKRKPSCKDVGCFGCCRGDLIVADGEAEAISVVLSEKQKAKIRDFDPSDSKTAVCPLLTEDKKCGIYSSRPAICRVYMVVTPSENCFPEKMGYDAVVASPYNEAYFDVMNKAIASVDQNPLMAQLKEILNN